jgi:hypothetical protein
MVLYADAPSATATAFVEAIVAGRLESWETSMAATVDGIRHLAEGEDERA